MMDTTLTVIFTGLAVVASAHAVIFAAATSWYTRQAGLWRTDYDAAQERAAKKPWWVRYYETAERRVL
jgi:hypothetical protein